MKRLMQRKTCAQRKLSTASSVAAHAEIDNCTHELDVLVRLVVLLELDGCHYLLGPHLGVLQLIDKSLASNLIVLALLDDCVLLVGLDCNLFRDKRLNVYPFRKSAHSLLVAFVGETDCVRENICCRLHEFNVLRIFAIEVQGLWRTLRPEPEW